MKSKIKAAQPVIGITLDYETSGGYSKLPWYAVRENYCTAVSRFGALPLPLPHEVAQAAAYLDLLDGLIITGGAFDVSPELYGDSARHEKTSTKDNRTQFEFAVTRGAIERKMPILGICGGEQLLNVVLGGTLIQHIPDTVKNALEHEQKNPRHEPGHEVAVVPGTLLHTIISSPLGGEQASASISEAGAVGGNPPPHRPPSLSLRRDSATPPQGGSGLIIHVNTAHHQAIATPAPGAVVNATTADGVIEGIEFPSHPFCLGVQWHPEYFVDAADKKIFQAFVSACSRDVR